MKKKVSDTEKKLRKNFDDAVSSWRVIANAQIRNANRIDNLVSIYMEMVTDWEFEPTIDEVQVCIDEIIEVYETSLEIIDGLKYEDFTDKEMADPVAPFIPDRFGVKTKREMYDAFNVFRCLRPLGERIEQMHSLIIDELSADTEQK